MADIDNQVATKPSDDGPQADQSSAPGNDMRPSELDKSEAMRVFKNWFKGDERHSKDWRVQAKTDFDFIAGDQWSEKDQALLKDQNRQPIVFNRSLTIIKAVAGMEINGRHEIAYLPRKLEDSAIDETLTGASKWMADECDGEDEESEAFEHTLICGLGVCEHRMDYEDEAEGKYIEESIDPLEFYWDRTAKKKNMVDRRRDWRVRTMPLGDAQQLFPDFNRDQLDAKWATNNDPGSPQKTLEERRVRDENSSGPLADQDEVTLVHVEWWEREDCWCVADPANNKMLKIDGPTYDKLKARHTEVEAIKAQAIPGYRQQKLTAAKTKRKVYKQAFLGQEILEIGPAKDPQRFSRTVITGQLHHTKKTWFGIVRTLRDPQMWGNKWLSQTLHILNSTAKGGVLAETDAFEDQRDAEQKWARPDGIVWMKRGALTGQGGQKVMAKPGGGNVEGYLQLLDMAINATRDVSGINLELIGQKDVNQPGILEAMRKQAGMTVLATMFDALRRMRKLVGRIRLYYIQNFLSDGRIIRITGQDGQKSIQLLRDKTLGEYDVVVDDTPTSPNQKQANWAIISSLLPAFKDQLMAQPQILLKVLEYSPLPQAMLESIRQMLNAPQQQDPMIEQAKQAQLMGLVAKASKDQAQAELFNKQAASSEATAMYDLAMAKNLLLKHQGDLAAAMNEARKAGFEAQKTQADVGKTQAETAHTYAKVATEQATADHTRAKAVGEHAGAAAQHAAAENSLASAHAARVGALIDALQPIPHHKDAFPPVPKKPVGA